jgi:hypothetical protein
MAEKAEHGVFLAYYCVRMYLDNSPSDILKKIIVETRAKRTCINTGPESIKCVSSFMVCYMLDLI